MAAVLSLASSKRSFEEAIAFSPTRLPAVEQSRTAFTPAKKIAWRKSPACAGSRQADPLPRVPNHYVQPRSRKNKSRIGIGTPRSQSKIYPDAASCSIRSFSLIPPLTLSLSCYFVGNDQTECLHGEFFRCQHRLGPGAPYADQLLRPNRKFTAARGLELKTPSAGKFKNLARDFPAEPSDLLRHLFELRRVEHDERSALRHGARQFRGKKTAGHAAIIKSYIIRPVILENPSEKAGEKILRGREIRRRHFDVIDGVGK